MKTLYPSESQLDEALVYDEQVSKDKDLNSEWGFDLDEIHMSKLYYRHLKQNEYGTWWQKYIIYKYPFLSKADDEGDAKNIYTGAVGEIKASYVDKEHKYSWWQCRPWEKIDFYYLIGIDRYNNWYRNDFFLTGAEFKEEIMFHRKLDVTHGRKTKEFKELEKTISTKYKLFDSGEIKYAEYKMLIESFAQKRFEIICDDKLELTARYTNKGINSNFGKRLVDKYMVDDINDRLRKAEKIYEKPKIQSTIFEYPIVSRGLFKGNEENPRSVGEVVYNGSSLWYNSK